MTNLLLCVAMLALAGNGRASNLPPAGPVTIDPLDSLVQLALRRETFCTAQLPLPATCQWDRETCDTDVAAFSIRIKVG